MKPERDVFQQRVETLPFGRRSLPVQNGRELLSQGSTRPPPRMPVVPQEMSQLMRQREALLLVPIRTIQEDQTVAPIGRQTSPQRTIAHVAREDSAVLAQPGADAVQPQAGQQDDRYW
jgi:hypothetical protein